MSQECYLNDISTVNKILSDSLSVTSGQEVESMKYYSNNISNFNEDIKEGVIIIFKNEKPIQIEYCDHVSESIEKFVKNDNDIQNIGIGVIYDIKNISSQERALKMIENYLGLIFNLN